MRNAFNGIYRDHMYCYRPNLLRDSSCVSACACVCVCPCVSLLLLATTCKSRFHDSHAHFTDNKTTQKGGGTKEEGKEVKKKTILALAFCTFKKFKHSVYPFSLKNFWYIHPHNVTHTHTCSVHWLQCSKIQTETSFFSFHMRHTINDPLPYPAQTISLYRHSLHNFLPFPFYLVL